MATKAEHGWTNVDVNLTISSDGDVDPLKVLRGITKGIKKLDGAMRDAVHAARHRGHTWEEIGDALGVTRQSAWERYGTSREEERARVVDEVLGSLKGPPGGPSLEEIRADERTAEREIEERKYGEND